MPRAFDENPYSAPQGQPAEKKAGRWDRVPARWSLLFAVLATCVIGVCVAIYSLMTSDLSEARLGVCIGIGMALGSLSTIVMKYSAEQSDREVWHRLKRLFE